MTVRSSAPTKLYSAATDYEAKLRRVMKRLGAAEYNFDHSRHEAWIEFRYKGGLYRFSLTVTQAQERKQRIRFGSDCFAQLVLGLEDLVRLVERGIYDLQTWIVGMKALPAATNLPECLVRLGFTETPTTEQVEARWKALVKTLHPDTGGNAADFIALQDAYKFAMAFVGGEAK